MVFNKIPLVIYGMKIDAASNPQVCNAVSHKLTRLLKSPIKEGGIFSLVIDKWKPSMVFY